MFKCICAVVVALLLNGCAQMFPARSHQLDTALYEISAAGNVFASNDSLLKKIEKKAKKLCSPQAYDFVDNNTIEWHESKTYIDGRNYQGSYKTLNKRAKCRIAE
ncbi:hypothetical protein [Agaribacterium haliotis]|uniref:hypothetical protein n=1 Tax=Agaribacterium haliotis TaxID=2013869 RepID=UPI000BB5627F|nr:hypothetical protein [Agaribacterium haliotis]